MPTQSEIEELARACGWTCSPCTMRWRHPSMLPMQNTLTECPNLFEPGPEHERMEIEFVLETEWVGTGCLAATALSGTLAARPRLYTKPYERPSLARGYAVLAYVRWRDGDE